MLREGGEMTTGIVPFPPRPKPYRPRADPALVRQALALLEENRQTVSDIARAVGLTYQVVHKLAKPIARRRRARVAELEQAYTREIGRAFTFDDFDDFYHRYLEAHGVFHPPRKAPRPKPTLAERIAFHRRLLARLEAQQRQEQLAANAAT
jgi:hypothetical protein